MASSTSTTENGTARVEPIGSPPTRLTSFGKMLTKTKSFELLVNKSFDLIDDSGDGVIDEAELYAGLLLMHIKLAKNAGPAACFPPNRATCDRMFRAADPDNSGTLDREEFHWVMGIMCAEILGRMFVFFAVMILTVPILTSYVIRLLEIQEETYLEKAVRTATTMLVMYFIIPWLWDKVDQHYTGSSTDVDQELLSSDRKEQRQERFGRRSVAQSS